MYDDVLHCITMSIPIVWDPNDLTPNPPPLIFDHPPHPPGPERAGRPYANSHRAPQSHQNARAPQTPKTSRTLQTDIVISCYSCTYISYHFIHWNIWSCQYTLLNSGTGKSCWKMPSRLWRDQKVWPSSWSNFVHPQRNQPSAPGYICPSRLHRPQRCRVALHHRQLVHLCRSRWTQCRSSWVINTRITHIKRMALVTAGHAVPFAPIVPIFLKFGPASQWPQPQDWPANHSPMPLPLLTASIQTPGPRSSRPPPLKLNLEVLSHWGTIPHNWDVRNSRTSKDDP